MSRTVEELIDGTPAFAPLSEYEFEEWIALFELEHNETEEAMRKAKG